VGVDARQSRATIDDVAARAGVSISTVSRVVNGRYGVAPATLDRVRAAVVDLGFETSLTARSLRSGRTNVIGVLVSDIEPFSAEVLKGIAHALRESSYELIVYSGGHRHEDGWEQRYLSRLAGTLTDGAILLTPTVVQVATSKPVVAVDPHVGGSRMPTIDTENFEGAIAATRHLVELGHRRIGFIGGRPDLESARRRELGYRVALEAAGIPVDPELITSGDFTEEAAEGPAHQLLSLTDRPTAIFAANDLTAIQTIRSAVGLGLAVPHDISIVGFDNIPESALTDPPLTTIDQSLHAVGREAVRALIELIEHPERTGPSATEPMHITLPTTLVVRQSCAAPRGATS
jgi:LacI family transcriptional regulator